MGTVQHSIEVKVPAHTAYDCLSHFEEYPHFMEDVEDVRRVDSNHLHWVTRMDNRPVEWEAEITEQEADRCIAWHNVSGPGNSGKLELQALDDASSRVTFTWHLDADQVPGPKAGDTDALMAQRLREDMARMKDFIEATSSNSADTLSDTSSPTGMDTQKAGGVGGVIAALGGTDAAAGAALSGSKKGGPGGPSLRELNEPAGAAGSPEDLKEGDRISAGAGAYASGGTGLGSAASASDTRTGTGTTSGAGSALTGGGTSAGRDPGVR